MGHFGAPQQLIPRYRTLLLVLVFGVQLQHGVGADVPVKGQGHEIALAVGVFHIGVEVFMGDVGAQAELLLAAKPAADIGGDVTTATIISGHRHRAHILGAFGHVVDHPAGLGNAALQTGQALEHFHLLLVFQRDVLLAGDGAPIDLVTAGRVQRKATHHEILVITDRRITVAH